VSDSKGEARSLAFLLLLEGVSALAWCVALGLGIADLRVVRRVSDYAADAADGESPGAMDGAVTAIVPARDEAANIAAWISAILVQPAVGDIIIADDSSSDETAAIAEQCGMTQPRLRGWSCDPPPAGWVGKNWAAHSASRGERSEWLLFSDADVRMQPGAVDAALAAARVAAERLPLWRRAMPVAIAAVVVGAIGVAGQSGVVTDSRSIAYASGADGTVK